MSFEEGKTEARQRLGTRKITVGVVAKGNSEDWLKRVGGKAVRKKRIPAASLCFLCNPLS